MTKNNIKKLREERGLSQAKLAEMIGVMGKSRAYKIFRWEKGELQPNAESLLKLSKALNVKIDEILE